MPSEKSNEELVEALLDEQAAYDRALACGDDDADVAMERRNIARACILVRFAAQDAKIAKLRAVIVRAIAEAPVAQTRAAEQMRESCARHVLERINLRTSEESAVMLRTFADEIRKLDVEGVGRGD